MSNTLLVDISAYWNLNDDGFGAVSLVDSTGNGNSLANPNNALQVVGKIDGGAGFGNENQNNLITESGSRLPSEATWGSASCWFNADDITHGIILGDYYRNTLFLSIDNGVLLAGLGNGGGGETQVSISVLTNTWYHAVVTYNGTAFSLYLNNNLIDTVQVDWSGQTWQDGGFSLGSTGDNFGGGYQFSGTIDEVGIWNRSLTAQEVTDLYNGGAGFTYPFYTPATQPLFYNNAENDGDWGNLLNWWQDSGFTTQATALPTATNPVNLYNQVTQNTQGADQCFCESANFWSANFGVGLTLQASGVVNMQGTSILAGTTTDGVSMHDSSQLAATSVVDGNVTMRDSSRAFGSILGNATIYYDGGNGQFPIGGTVAGSVNYIGWPAVSPQWFNDLISVGGAGDGDWNNQLNWWTSNTFTTRPINAEGYQQLPDASTDVFIAPNIGITSNSGTANPTINSVTANNSNIQNISITATNGFLFSGNEGVENAVLYGDVIFQDTAYNDHSVINGKATYKSAASLQYSWGQNSLGNVNAGMYNGSTSFEVNISSGGGGGTISRLLNLPWFINI